MSTEQNKANYLRFIEEVWNEGNLTVVDELASPEVVFHFLPPDTPPGGESMKQFIALTRTAFPDLRITIEDQFSAGDRTVARYTMTGTQRGPYPNHLKTIMPPTGRRFSAQGIDIWRFDANGKGAECWSVLDRLGMLQQLGVIPKATPSTNHVNPEAEVNHGTS